MSTLETTRPATRVISDVEAQVLAEAEAGRRRARQLFILRSIAANIAVLIVVAIALFPIYFVLEAAFRPGNSLYTTSFQFWPDHPSLENWQYMFTEHENVHLLLWLRNSLLVAVTTTIFSVALCTTAAYAFSRWRFAGRNGILTVLLAINAFPGVFGLVALFVIFKSVGLLDTLWALIIAYTSGQLIFSTWNMKGFFDTIPVDLEEAARVDGATPTQAFFRVMLPLARPVLVVTALLGFLAGWTEYVVAQLLLFKEGNYTSMVGLINMATDYRQPWGWFAVGALVMILPIMVLFLLLQKQLQGGLLAGGVKG